MCCRGEGRGGARDKQGLSPSLSLFSVSPSETEEPYLEGQEQKKRLDGVEASVDKVPHEQVVLLRAFPSDLEELQHVEELPVNVTAYRHRWIDGLHVALLHEYVYRSQAKRPHLRLVKELALLELGDPIVQVGRRRRHSLTTGPATRHDATRHARTLVLGLLEALEQIEELLWLWMGERVREREGESGGWMARRVGMEGTVPVSFSISFFLFFLSFSLFPFLSSCIGGEVKERGTEREREWRRVVPEGTGASSSRVCAS